MVVLREKLVQIIVDLEIKTDLRRSCVTDNLEDTVDYVLLNTIVEEMCRLFHLLNMWLKG
jgi:dihydroneopterin aldolase